MHRTEYKKKRGETATLNHFPENSFIFAAQLYNNKYRKTFFDDMNEAMEKKEQTNGVYVFGNKRQFSKKNKNALKATKGNGKEKQHSNTSSTTKQIQQQQKQQTKKKKKSER